MKKSQIKEIIRTKLKETKEKPLYKDWGEYMKPKPHILVTLNNGKKIKIQKSHSSKAYQVILQAFGGDNYKLTNKIISQIVKDLNENFNDGSILAHNRWIGMTPEAREDLLLQYTDSDTAEQFSTLDRIEDLPEQLYNDLKDYFEDFEKYNKKEEEDDDEEWIDPAGGSHYRNEDDPASSYLEEGEGDSEFMWSRIKNNRKLSLLDKVSEFVALFGDVEAEDLVKELKIPLKVAQDLIKKLENGY